MGADFSKFGIFCEATRAHLAVFRLLYRGGGLASRFLRGALAGPLPLGAVIRLSVTAVIEPPAGTMVGEAALGTNHYIIVCSKGFSANGAGQIFIIKHHYHIRSGNIITA